PRMLTVQPFDPSSIRSIEKAIQESDLGLTPSNDGKLIRLPIPQLTEERRKELVKVVRNMAEEHRVAVREIRRDAMRHLKELVDNGDVGADEEHRAEGRVQELTDEHTKQIDELLKHKEAEVMEVCAHRSPAPTSAPRSTFPRLPTQLRSSWTGADAGRPTTESRWPKATAPGHVRCVPSSRRRSTSASSRWRSTPSRPRTGAGRSRRSRR